ncbi:MAG: hypothetical protein MN733_19905, partial [Nitrososphaera sp.]|nr:hypothetical protein [Nitrososphaera sp.]
MAATAAIYLAHLNPMTKAHEAIITSLLQQGYHAYVFPVRFLKDGREVNAKSFPFSYELRKLMVESVFGDTVTVLPQYAFYAPFVKYMPPLLSSRSWKLRNEIIVQIREDDFVSYTGDNAERLMLRAYRLKPLKAKRHEISASSVRELMYQDALDKGGGKWQEKVPEPVVEIIRKN